MSAAHDAHADTSDGHHDAHDHFDNEPSTELGPDETRTANWVPYLGLALFFSAGVALMVSSDGDKPAEGKAVAAEAAAMPPPTPQPGQMGQQRPALPVQPGQPGQMVQPGQAPGANGVNALKQLSPEQAKELQKRIEALRAAQPNGGNPNGAQPAPQPARLPQPGAVPQPAPQPLPAQ